MTNETNSTVSNKEALAAFDFDGTIYKGSLLEDLLDCMTDINVGIISPTERFHAVYGTRRTLWFDNTLDNYKVYTQDLIDLLIDKVKGVSEDSVLKAVDVMWWKYYEKQYRFTRNLAEYLQDTHEVVGITGSPQFAAERLIGGVTGLDAIVGSHYEVVDGVFTGEARGVGNKDEVVKELNAQYGFTSFAGAVAVGNTVDDIPMLEAVSTGGVAIAFNPTRETRIAAMDWRWPMVEERSNNIKALFPAIDGVDVLFDPTPEEVLERASV